MPLPKSEWDRAPVITVLGRWGQGDLESLLAIYSSQIHGFQAPWETLSQEIRQRATEEDTDPELQLPHTHAYMCTHVYAHVRLVSASLTVSTALPIPQHPANCPPSPTYCHQLPSKPCHSHSCPSTHLCTQARVSSQILPCCSPLEHLISCCSVRCL